MLKSVIHFLVHVCMVFSELPNSIGLDLLDPLLLPLELGVELLGQLGLSLQPALLLRVYCVLHLVRFFL